jgi:hypothetical protein
MVRQALVMAWGVVIWAHKQYELILTISIHEYSILEYLPDCPFLCFLKLDCSFMIMGMINPSYKSMFPHYIFSIILAFYPVLFNKLS